MKTPLLFTLFFIVNSIFINAQNVIKAEIIDNETAEAISFATIKFEDTNRGIIADYNGQFRLPTEKLDSISTLIITSIGFKDLRVAIDSLSLNEINILKMIPQIEQLETVILQGKGKDYSYELEAIYEKSKNMMAFEIVRRAIDRIKFNLNLKPHSYVGYYRDYQIINEGEYYNLNESIIEQFDGGILSNKITSEINQAALYYYKENSQFKRDTIMSYKYDEKNKYLDNAKVLNYGGNELMLLNVHNPIRIFKTRSFSFVYELDTDFIENHMFYKGDIIMQDEEPIITITFETRDQITSPIHNAKGVLKISLSDFSIYAFEYSLFDRNKFNPLMNVNIEYQKINDIMYLNYLTFNNRFVIRDNDIFKEDFIAFDKKDNSFYVKFNRKFNPKSIKKRNFKIKYKDKRIPILDAFPVDDRKAKIIVADYDMSDLKSISNRDKDQLSVIIRRVRDYKNEEIYTVVNKRAYQFREFFVQEVFENKNLNDDLIYIKKLQPLSESEVNGNKSYSNYIINSPLMNRKF